MNQVADYDLLLDAKGLRCPLPLLKMKQQLNTMSNGQVLKILATDPGAVRDFQVFSSQAGHELLVADELDGHFSFLIRKS